jgi:hypothetical protein
LRLRNLPMLTTESLGQRARNEEIHRPSLMEEGIEVGVGNEIESESCSR